MNRTVHYSDGKIIQLIGGAGELDWAFDSLSARQSSSVECMNIAHILILIRFHLYTPQAFETHIEYDIRTRSHA